jgi:hypothetical protein
VSDREQLDPEIAQLLGVSAEGNLKPSSIESAISVGKSIPKTDLRPINIQKVLEDKNNYTKIIGETGEFGQRFHELLGKFLKSDTKDEKSMYREKLIPAYWNMLGALIDTFFEKLTDEKLALYRYALLNYTFIDEEQKQALIAINAQNGKVPDFFYIDEWLLLVGNGKIRTSAVDETVKVRKQSPSALKEKIERKAGARVAELANLKQKIGILNEVEINLKQCVESLLNHESIPDFDGLIAPYTLEQKRSIAQLQDILKNLAKADKEIENSYDTIRSLDEEISSIRERGGDMAEQVDTKTVIEEFSTVRQMIKMTVGRQGNHFPFLVRSYMPRNARDIATKENLFMMIREIEAIDPGIFIRKYKQEEHRIVPHFIIVPTYGDFGICWEPFEQSNRATGKGRIAVPMYSRELKTAVLYALGDLRWQIAKEKAMHYWMEEGLTGNYYEYTQVNKLKGDLKEYFIQDYILWIKFESQGMQKLHKDVRSIFWRQTPFPQELKDELKNRGYYYSELYKKDQNRAVSRGY